MLPTDKPYLIGETAFHHQGDVSFLKELIKQGGNCEVDAIKVHLLLDLDDYMAHDHEALEVLRPWCLSEANCNEIINYGQKLGLDIILLCNDVKSVKYAIRRQGDVKAIEIHATGINDVFLLKAACDFEGTVILGTGGSTLDEIKYAVDYLNASGQQDIFLMHGFQNYPTDYTDINLGKMRALKDMFKLPIGYADHTDPVDIDNELVSVLGVAQGFNVLEKHFTHMPDEKRIDSQAAVSLAQLKNIRRVMNKAFLSFGRNALDMSAAEQKYGNTGPMKKAIVAREDTPSGKVLELTDIAFKRTNESSYLSQSDLGLLIGNKLKEAVKKDQILGFDSVNYSFQMNDFSQFHNK